MNTADLLTHFDRVSEVPDAIPRLRGFILDLAVRGRLVEQEAQDQPASELLKSIKTEKTRLVQAGELGRQDLRELYLDEAPFEVPLNWVWTTLGEICSKTGSGSTPRGGKSVYKDCGIPFLRSQNVYDEGLRLDDVAYIDQQTHQRMAGTVVKPGDLLLNITGGSMGRCCRVPADFIEANISQHVAIIRLILGGMQDFLHRLILSPYFQSFIFNEQTGAGRGGLPKNRMDRIPVAVPPLAEQHRIVAKVDELMAMCDQLEAARSERERRRDQLTEASLNRLKHPEEIDESTFREHARFHLRHFPWFTTRPDQIAQLRQTILNLAVRGRLVSQNANSESIAAFLEAVDTERSATAERDRRANKERQKLLASELCWTTPTSWVWRALADLALFIDYRGQTPAKCEFGVRLLTAKNVRAGFINLEPQEFIDEPTYERWMTRGLPREGDVLFTTEAPMGNAAVLKLSHKIGLAQRVINFRLYGGLNPDFLVLQILSDPFQKILAATATGLTAKGIKAAKLKRLPIAIPPLAEQQRIVAKVKELMSLCDRLETEIKISQTQRRLLLEAVLHQALSLPA